MKFIRYISIGTDLQEFVWELGVGAAARAGGKRFNKFKESLKVPRSPTAAGRLCDRQCAETSDDLSKFAEHYLRLRTKLG